MTNGRRTWFNIGMVLAITSAVLLAMGRSAICPCGHVGLWHGSVNSTENSQQLTDWYSFTHIVHGLIFYGAGWLVLRRASFGTRLTIATIVEAAWEVVENSPFVIERYRAATIAIGYTGDSVLNSMSDIGCMMVGFWLARRLPVKAVIALAIAFELFTLWAIRDNLSPNILMLVAPNDAVRAWQASGQ